MDTLKKGNQDLPDQSLTNPEDCARTGPLPKGAPRFKARNVCITKYDKFLTKETC